MTPGRASALPLWAVLLLVVAVPLAVSVLDAMEAPPPPPPRVAPDFTLTSTGYENGTFTDPVTFHLSDYRGRVVLLDFMAVKCTSCRYLTEEVLLPLHAEFGDGGDRGGRSGFVVLSIDTWADPATGSATFGGETQEDLVALQQSEGVPWRHALDTDEVYLKYDAVALPEIALVAADGTIAYEATGIPHLEDVRSAVASALADALADA